MKKLIGTIRVDFILFVAVGMILCVVLFGGTTVWAQGAVDRISPSDRARAAELHASDTRTVPYLRTASPAGGGAEAKKDEQIHVLDENVKGRALAGLPLAPAAESARNNGISAQIFVYISREHFSTAEIRSALSQAGYSAGEIDAALPGSDNVGGVGLYTSSGFSAQIPAIDSPGITAPGLSEPVSQTGQSRNEPLSGQGTFFGLGSWQGLQSQRERSLR